MTAAPTLAVTVLPSRRRARATLLAGSRAGALPLHWRQSRPFSTTCGVYTTFEPLVCANWR